MPRKKERRNLRDLLLDAIEEVKDGTLEPNRATAVAELSQAVLRADQFELDAMAFVAEHGKPTRIANRKPLAIEHHEVEADGEVDEEAESDEEETDEPEDAESGGYLTDDLEVDMDKLTLLVEGEQPIKLAELSARTGLPQRDLFAAMKDERFENSTDGYWLSE